MKIHHLDGFESEPFYGYFDTISTVKMIRSDGTIGLVDSNLYNLAYRRFQGDPIP